MSEKKALFIITILNNIIDIYFDTFFVFYFFKVANYEVLPLAKYYLTLYLFIGIGFFLIRNNMKKNNKVPYFRIGISLQAIYIALIMLLKEKIINYIFLVGIIKGLADGFYHFPKNILSTEIISNDDRQRYSGFLKIAKKVSSIIVPIILGVALTFISYTNLGKLFFALFIFMFIISFYIKDYNYYDDKKIEIKKFWKIIKENKNVRYSLLLCLLSGLTYSSGVMSTIITLMKINVFKSNLNLGFVDSACSVIYLIICTLFAIKISKEKFSNIAKVSGIISFITLLIFALYPRPIVLVIYLFVRNSCVGLISMIGDNASDNLSNTSELKNNYKSEYYLFKDIMYSISRCTGYLTLLLVCLIIGMGSINYILIICAISLLFEGIIVSNLSKK